MSSIAIRLPDQTIKDLDGRAKKLHISRSEYIRLSIERMNTAMQKQEKKDQLIVASKLVRKDSMNVNAEFDLIENE